MITFDSFSEKYGVLTFFHRLVELIFRVVSSLEQAFLDLTRPSPPSVGFSTALDFTRSQADLIAENAWLCQQLIVLRRQVNRPRFSPSDRLWLVLLASRVKNWKHARLILKPDTLLRWHRQGFRLFWKFKSRHLGVTRSPTDEWVAQQLCAATPFGQAPRFLIRDRDRRYGEDCTRVAVGTSIQVLKTPYHAPKANAICERFLGSMRRECLDHILVLGEKHLYRVIGEYMAYFNHARPHQGIEQQIPEGSPSVPERMGRAKIIAFPVLNGLHHDYRLAA